jgi:hypothetical protein
VVVEDCRVCMKWRRQGRSTDGSLATQGYCFVPLMGFPCGKRSAFQGGKQHPLRAQPPLRTFFVHPACAFCCFGIEKGGSALVAKARRVCGSTPSVISVCF